MNGIIWNRKINCCSRNLLILLGEVFVYLRCLRLALSECIFMYKRWGCPFHLWENTVSQQTERSNCYLKVLPCLGREDAPCIRSMALGSFAELMRFDLIWCQRTCIPVCSRASVLSSASHIVVPLKRVCIWLILVVTLEGSCIVFSFVVGNDSPLIVLLSLLWKAVKIVKND